METRRPCLLDNIELEILREAKSWRAWRITYRKVEVQEWQRSKNKKMQQTGTRKQKQQLR